MITRPNINLKFWIKTALHRLVPGGYGYIKELRKGKSSTYNHKKDKHPVRNKHHGQGGWKGEDQSDLNYRDYSDYDEYLTHQSLKLDELIKIKGGFSNKDIFDYRLRFYRRFKYLSSFLPEDALIICLGARQGTEVETLRDIGYGKAQGLDLNPGSGNDLVKKGDFMNLDYETSTVDLIYSNCVDHAFDLEKYFTEGARVIKEDGYALYDLNIADDDGGAPFEAVRWSGNEEIIKMILNHYSKLIKVETEENWTWILVQGKKEA